MKIKFQQDILKPYSENEYYDKSDDKAFKVA